ncbi:MAG: hypothetical protein ABIH03_06035, partial [Pseudomonadota bacterium]
LRDRTTRLLTQIPERDAQLLKCFHDLESNGAFTRIVERIAERLSEVDADNRTRGVENKYTEAEAWEWFLAAVAKAKKSTAGLVIETRKT